jgi:hypothetical protein
MFSRYEAADYKGVYEDYKKSREKNPALLRALPLDT